MEQQAQEVRRRPASRCAPCPGNCPGDFPANCPVWLTETQVLPRKTHGPVGATERPPQRTQHPSIAPTGAAEEGSALAPRPPNSEATVEAPRSRPSPHHGQASAGGTLWPHPGCGPRAQGSGILVFSLPSRQQPALPGKPHSTLSSAPLAGRAETR